MSRITTSHDSVTTSWPQVYMGVAFTTMATLLLELAMTRIFSVVFYYHFAFLAISIALFGLGAGGVFSYVIAAQPAPLFRKLGRLSLINAVMPLISVVFILTRGQELTNTTLAAVYFFSALPFFLAGAIVSLAISETIERIDRVYFFDLLGAAGGCLLLIPLLNNFGGPNTVIAAAVLFAVGAAIWYNLDGHPPLRAASVAIALVLTVLVVLNTKSHWIDVHYAKGQKLDNEIFVKWNTFSRISVAKEKASGQTQIVIDADASTGIMDFNVDALTPEQVKDLTQQGAAFPYVMRPGAKTLIIGPGGGWDVARALASGSKDITGVEINPIIASTVMRGEFASISRNLYRRPGIRIFEEDGRSFVRRSTEKYSVLQATLVDTWASTAAGAFALSENNLYTTDAFYDYLSHLNDDGVLAITRWGFDPPRESVRLLILAREALKQLGENDPQRHVMVIREGSQKELEGWGARDTVLISRKPFTEADVARAQTIIATSRFQQIYLPGDGAKNPFGQALLSQNLEGWLKNYPFDVTAADDNRPFFFYTVQPRDLWNFLTTMNKDSADYKINRAVPMLFSLVGISILATIIILALPPLVLGTRLPREKGVLQFLMYFLCIGVGYILIQVALIQKFVLFLGHPTYALTVIIFSMLVASGCGSFLSGKYIGNDDGKLMRALGLVTVLVSMLAFSASHITTALVGLPLPVKMLLTVLLIAPAGFCMGMPFPQGLARLEAFHKPSVRWAWSLNAASSVLGSAAAIFFAIYLGLRETLLLGGALYLGALVILKITSPHRSHMSLESLFSLKGKTALVVGASRGIGLAIAKEIAAAGAHTILAARSADKLAEEVAALKEQGYSADYRTVDMADSESIRTFAAAFRGQTDILINVAGTNVRRRMQDYTKEEYNRILDINLHSIFELCQHIGGGMVERGRGGKIIHIGSLMSLLGIPYLSVYAISKGGLGGLTRVQAAEWGKSNIQVNCIAPGFILTALNQDMWKPKHMHDWLHGAQANPRMGTPEDLAGLAVFLSAPASDYVTGQVIAVDGGYTTTANWPFEPAY